MAFSLTTPQFRARTKDVTRRTGWEFIRRGDVLMAIEKGQGLKKGEMVTRLGRIRIVNVRRERLLIMVEDREYGRRECEREGFPQLTPEQFIRMFCAGHRVTVGEMTQACLPSDTVTRIEYEYLEPLGDGKETRKT